MVYDVDRGIRQASQKVITLAIGLKSRKFHFRGGKDRQPCYSENRRPCCDISCQYHGFNVRLSRMSSHNMQGRVSLVLH